MKKSIIFVFSVLFSFLLLNSCSDEDNTEKSRMCTVSYDADTGGEILNTSVAYGEVAHKTDWKPSKPGYTFLGWYYTDEFGEETEYPFTIAVTENVTLTARYSLNSYTVSFEANADETAVSGSMNDIYCDYDKEYELPENQFTCIGSEFRGWSLTPGSFSDSKIDYDDKAAVKNLSEKNGGHVILYAVWSENSWHNISYRNIEEELGVTMPAGYVRKFREKDRVSLENPVRTGYEFKGWYETSDYSGKRITTWGAGTYTSDLTVYAKWEVLSFTVTLNDRDNITECTVDYEGFIPELTVSPVDGAKFGGFFTEPYGRGERYISSAGRGDKKYLRTEGITLYAFWEYSIEYNDVDNYTNTNPVSYTGEYDLELQPLIVKNGYVFKGWKDEDGNPVTKILSGTSGKKIFTSMGALLKNYKITYNKNGGIWDDTPGDEYIPTEEYNIESKTLLLPQSTDIKKQGFVFDGWYADENFKGNAVITIESGSYGDIELGAKWIEIE